MHPSYEEHLLLEEIETHRDVAILPLRDQYVSLPDKAWALFAFLRMYWGGDADYFMKLDVDACLNVTAAVEAFDVFEVGRWEGLYLGVWEYSGAEGRWAVRGADNKPAAPYMVGGGS